MTGDGRTAYDGDPADGYKSKCTDKAVEAYRFDVALPAPEPAARTLRAAAAKRLVIAPRARPLLLP